MHFSFCSTPKLVPRCRITRGEGDNDLAALRIVAPMQPSQRQYSCDAVEDRKLLFLR